MLLLLIVLCKIQSLIYNSTLGLHVQLSVLKTNCRDEFLYMGEMM